eukprot:1152965-Pleurochrysis_carterae.AAC.1
MGTSVRAFEKLRVDGRPLARERARVWACACASVCGPERVHARVHAHVGRGARALHVWPRARRRRRRRRARVTRQVLPVPRNPHKPSSYTHTLSNAPSSPAASPDFPPGLPAMTSSSQAPTKRALPCPRSLLRINRPCPPLGGKHDPP